MRIFKGMIHYILTGTCYEIRTLYHIFNVRLCASACLEKTICGLQGIRLLSVECQPHDNQNHGRKTWMLRISHTSKNGVTNFISKLHLFLGSYFKFVLFKQ